MKKRKYIWGIIAILCGCLVIPAYNYYAPATELDVYECHHHSDDTLRIAMIGDSWVFYHYLFNDTLASKIRQNTGKPVKVNAYGQCGKTSKEVYQSIFNDQSMQTLLSQGADYCFVSVGINDSYKKMGANYYSKSTAYILHFLIQNGIKPILLTIPNYDISYTYERQTTDKKMLRQLSMLITRSQLDCREDYRQALMQELQKTGLENRITLLRFPYSLDYYQSDRMHLNTQGYQMLDSIICACIFQN